MYAARFMDKQIMDLSRSKSDLSTTTTTNKDFLDLINPQSEDDQVTPAHNTTTVNKEDDDVILPNYDFQPIHRPSPPPIHSLPSADISKLSFSPSANYNSLDNVEPDKIVLEKAEKTNDFSILSEINRTMQKYTDNLMHAIDTLSTRLSQMESTTRHIEHSVEDLKISIGNNHGSVDGKLRQLENILLEVQTDVHTLKDKQEVMEEHILQAKLQISKVERSSELPKTVHQEPVQQSAGASAPQQSGLLQFPVTVPQSITSMPSSNVFHPPSQQNTHFPPPMTSPFPPAVAPSGPHREAYIIPPTQAHEAPSQQYKVPPLAQPQQQPPAAASQPQQYQPAPTPPYPQPPQQPHLSLAATNAPPPFQPPLGHRPDENLYVPQTYPPNLHQPPSQPTSSPPQSQSYYGSPSSMYEPPPPARSSSGFPSAYVPPSGLSEPYPYGGSPSHYGSGSTIKTQPHPPGGSAGNYPQLPTARIVPQAIPTASGISSGSNSGGSGNRVPIDDVVDKVTNMGFSREQVKATVHKLTENGQSVDLNVVLDKLMNDADVQPPRGWFNQ